MRCGTLEFHSGQDSILLEGDEHLLRRVIENLLDNALRYAPAGGRVEVTQRRVTFTIAVTGPGISRRDLPHVFDPLYRGDAARNQETGGTGLGLAIVQRILKAHGGDIVAANRARGERRSRHGYPLGQRESQLTEVPSLAKASSVTAKAVSTVWGAHAQCLQVSVLG